MLAPFLINLASALLLSLSALADPTPTRCSLPADETAPKTVYAFFCDSVLIDGVVKGDVVAVAGSVTINGEVQGSVLAAANQITINGHVDRSIRTFSADLEIQPKASLGGSTSDVFALALTFESRVALPGDVWLVGRDARFYREVLGQKYLALLPPSLPDNPGTWFADFVWGTIQRFLVFSGVGLAMLAISRKHLETPTQVFIIRPIRTLLYGEGLFFIGLPVLLLLVACAALAVIALTAGGLVGISLIFSGATVLCILSAAVLVIGLFGPIIFAYGIGNRLVKNAPFNALLLGAFLVAVLSSLPRVGWVAVQIVGCAGMGAWWLRNRA